MATHEKVVASANGKRAQYGPIDESRKGGFEDLVPSTPGSRSVQERAYQTSGDRLFDVRFNQL
jgi:hypothetical protein